MFTLIVSFDSSDSIKSNVVVSMYMMLIREHRLWAMKMLGALLEITHYCKQEKLMRSG